MRIGFRIALFVMIVALGFPPAYLLMGGSGSEAPSRRAHLGDTEALYEAFARWEKWHEENDGDRNMVLRLGWVRGVSPQRTPAQGTVELDLVQGSVRVRVSGLAPEASWDVWLFDDQAADGNERRIHLGTLSQDGNQASLWRFLGADFFDEVEVDRLVVAPAGEDPEIAGLLHAAPNLFQWLHNRKWMAQPEPFLSSRLGVGSILSPRPVFAQISSTPIDTMDDLIARGADLFFNETFGGNGRTCGTCHPAENNLTIDPRFIATLPKSDKLFIAEDPNFPLSELEKPALMRRFGVILENVDGLENPTEKFVLRGVPHTLALPTSLTPAPPVTPFDPTDRVDGSTVPPVERTGWSGDGAPDDGSLFFFAKGAVIQHFPKSLNRQEPFDFVLPTTSQLRAMEAFQLSLGRQSELDLGAITFSDPVVERGKVVFNGSGACFFCHNNAGANTGGGTNFNFDTGVERQAALPIQVFDPTIPFDGGFGKDLHPTNCDIPDAGAADEVFGNCTFNTPTLVEAADTGPFFHNNSMDTIEAAVGFYNTAAFANAPNGFPISMSGSEVQAVAAMLRAINAQENLRNAIVQEQRALLTNDLAARRALLNVAIAETIDAIEVLEGANLHLDLLDALEKALVLLDGGTNPEILEAIDIQTKVQTEIGS